MVQFIPNSPTGNFLAMEIFEAAHLIEDTHIRLCLPCVLQVNSCQGGGGGVVIGLSNAF